MTSDDPTPSTGEPEPNTPKGSPSMQWTYVGLAAVPRDRATLTVDQTDGRHTYKPGDPVPMTQQQHDFLVHEGHLFQEDIVQTPGG